jgi:hypothetical protein
VSHPASGSVLPSGDVVCGPCVRRFWSWASEHGKKTYRVGPKGKGSKYIAFPTGITKKNMSKRRTSRRTRRNPPPLYRAIGIDSSGARHTLGAGPLARMRDTAMALWLSDPQLKSVFVLDRLGHSYLSLEPKDRRALQANPRKRRRTSRK